jgi:hypothetical protein
MARTERMCYCSKHPYGIPVSQQVARRHAKRDRRKGILPAAGIPSVSSDSDESRSSDIDSSSTGGDWDMLTAPNNKETMDNRPTNNTADGNSEDVGSDLEQMDWENNFGVSDSEHNSADSEVDVLAQLESELELDSEVDDVKLEDIKVPKGMIIILSYSYESNFVQRALTNGSIGYIFLME